MLHVCFYHQNSFGSDFLIYVVFNFIVCISFDVSIYCILYNLLTVFSKYL